ncbi:uncharacterized [Tachysurus ichikawai]
MVPQALYEAVNKALKQDAALSGITRVNGSVSVGSRRSCSGRPSGADRACALTHIDTHALARTPQRSPTLLITRFPPRASAAPLTR